MLRMRPIRKFFALNDEKPTDENIMRMLVPSFIGIAACAVCLVGLTFAWFTASVSAPPMTITASNFSVSVKVDETDVLPNPDGSTTVTFSAEGTYIVTLTNEGTGNGYCKIKAYDSDVFTQPIGEDFTFTVVTDEAVECLFIPVWGSYSGVPDVTEGDNNTVNLAEFKEEQPEITEDIVPPASEITPDSDREEITAAPTVTAPGPTPEITYMIQPGDTLGAIAEMFDTTIDKLAAYNGIKNVNKIYAGQILNIPPEDYVIPDQTAE